MVAIIAKIMKPIPLAPLLLPPSYGLGRQTVTDKQVAFAVQCK